MTRPSLALALALLASACAHKSRATQKTSEAHAAAPKEEVVCYNEQPTGSHIAKMVCYTQEQLGMMSQAVQDFFRQATQSSPRRAGNAAQRPSTGGGR
jgi:membrane-bound lytic murein transglycosylase B